MNWHVLQVCSEYNTSSIRGTKYLVDTYLHLVTNDYDNNFIINDRLLWSNNEVRVLT